ncbi:MAG: hypothetical protein V4555_01965 [Acidobacteriota bacterium]
MQIDEWQDRAMGWARSPQAKRVLEAAVVLLSAFLLLLFLYAAWRRVRYPFEVEWIESNMLVSVLRILHGQGLYVAPSLDFVPYLYAPVYLYLAAAVTKVVGVGDHGYAGLRLVSALATLVSCAAIYALVKTETARRVPAIAAAGLYVGCYAMLGTFFDIGRVDTLFVCLMLLALLAQRRGYLILAALLWVLCAQTKQTVFPMAFFILCAEWQRPRRMVAALATYVVAAEVSIHALNHATGGWYGYYVFHVAKGLPIVWRQAALYLPTNVLAPIGIAWVVIVAALVLTRPQIKSAVAMFYGFVSVGVIGIVWAVQAHRGASNNAMMPVFAWVAVMFGVAMARLLERGERRGMPQLSTLVLVAAAAQLAALIYNPGGYIPTQNQRAATEQFIGELRALPGDVWVIDHGYDALLAGKQAHSDVQALGAVLDAPGLPSQPVREEFEAAKRDHRFSVVVVDNTNPKGSFQDIDQAYPLAISTGLGPYRYMTSQAQWFLLPCETPLALSRTLETADRTIMPRGCDY